MGTAIHAKLWNPIGREVIIDKTTYHVRSVFIGQTNLDDALKRIISRRLEERCAADATQGKIQQTALV